MLQWISVWMLSNLYISGVRGSFSNFNVFLCFICSCWFSGTISPGAGEVRWSQWDHVPQIHQRGPRAPIPIISAVPFLIRSHQHAYYFTLRLNNTRDSRQFILLIDLPRHIWPLFLTDILTLHTDIRSQRLWPCNVSIESHSKIYSLFFFIYKRRLLRFSWKATCLFRRRWFPSKCHLCYLGQELGFRRHNKGSEVDWG